MFESIREWRDLTDGHVYKAGEAFPHDGREVSPERLKALLSGSNKAGLVMIREIARKAKKPEVIPDLVLEVKPEETPEEKPAPKTRSRRKK